MPKTIIDVAKLTTLQITLLFQNFERLERARLINNNLLATAFEKHPDTTDRQVDLLNEWANRGNQISEMSEMEIARILAGATTPARPA